MIMILRNRIPIQLAERRMNMTDLAKRIEAMPGVDLSYPTIYRITQGETIPHNIKLSSLVAIAEGIGCKLADLYEETAA